MAWSKPIVLGFLEIDVVDDFGKGGKAVVLKIESPDHDLEGTSIAFMRIISLEHVEADFSGNRRVVNGVDVFEDSGFIHSAPDQPAAGDSVHKNIPPGNPDFPFSPSSPSAGTAASLALPDNRSVLMVGK